MKSRGRMGSVIELTDFRYTGSTVSERNLLDTSN